MKSTFQAVLCCGTYTSDKAHNCHTSINCIFTQGWSNYQYWYKKKDIKGLHNIRYNWRKYIGIKQVMLFSFEIFRKSKSLVKRAGFCET